MKILYVLEPFFGFSDLLQKEVVQLIKNNIGRLEILALSKKKKADEDFKKSTQLK